MTPKIKNLCLSTDKRPPYKPFSWRLDGGGRQLILSLLDQLDIKCMVEIGVLYGGSSKQWLEHKADLELIGIDPWEFDEDQVKHWWKYREVYGLCNLDQNGMTDEEFLNQILERDAGKQTTISNLWDFRDRFYPIQGRSPEMLYALANIEVVPDLVYFDSDKQLTDIWVCHSLWPNAVICGDDWTWAAEGVPDVYPVQIAVNKFAQEKQMTVTSQDATWYLTSLQCSN